MYTVFMVVHIFVSMVLILVILMQAGRGGGVSELFGGTSTQTVFGTSVTKFLMRATAACAILFIITSLSLAVLSSRRSRSLMESGKALSIDVEEAVDATQEDAMPAEYEIPTKEEMPVEDEKEPIEPESE